MEHGKIGAPQNNPIDLLWKIANELHDLERVLLGKRAHENMVDCVIHYLLFFKRRAKNRHPALMVEGRVASILCCK